MNKVALLKELTTWHAKYLIDDEDWDRFIAADMRLAWGELSDRIGPLRPTGAERRTALARYAAGHAFLRTALKGVRTGVLDAEARGFLVRAVDTGLVTYRLGTPGEVALSYVRDLRGDHRPNVGPVFALARLVESGRLVAPTAARCARCRVARPVAEFDLFSSPTSGDRLYVCHGVQRPPEDRLGLDPWDDVMGDWGQPCCVWDPR